MLHLPATSLARFESALRPALVRLPPSLALRVYARGRRTFLDAFVRQCPSATTVPGELSKTLWGIHFRAPILNAAGMFKSGDGYGVVARQGAGAWLAGTTTASPRQGNRRAGVAQPFAPYPRSGAASNWLGLPNPGHAVVAARLKNLERIDGCPIGASVAADPDPDRGAEEKLETLVDGMRLYADAGVDFLEMNESCPNTEEADPAGLDALGERLRFVRHAFLERRGRPLPVIVKLSCDTDPAQVNELVALLVEHGFDGVNFGNTSTAYAALREDVATAERALFDTFTERFGGGVSGRPLKARSLELVRHAAVAVDQVSQEREFHVLRTGGVESAEDLREGESVGVALHQWYTGYFEAFARHGHGLYSELYEKLAER